MGVVIRQGSRNLIIYVISMAFGIINNLFIFPYFIALYGFLQTIVNLHKLFAPFCIWGLGAVMNRFYIIYEDTQFDGFLRFVLKWFAISFSGFVFFFLVFIPQIVEYLKPFLPHIDIVVDYRYHMLILLFISGLIIILSNLSHINKRVVMPTILSRLVHNKILYAILILVSGYYALSSASVFIGIIICSFLIFLGLLYYDYRNGWINFNAPKVALSKEERKGMLTYGTFGIFNDTGMYFAFSIDVVMINFILGDTSAGLYAIFLFLANVIKIPIDAISNLVLPLIANLWKKNDVKTISDYYKRTANTLFIICLGLFITIYVSLDQILTIIDKSDLIVCKFIFLFISIGILINSIMSLNGSILVQSEKYKWNLMFTLILAVLNIILTYYFVKYLFPAPYQAAGAACSTAVSLIIFNFLKTFYIYKSFKMVPFSSSMIATLSIGLITLGIMTNIDLTLGPWLSLFIKSGLTAFIFFVSIYMFALSKDLNENIDKAYLQIKAKF